MKPTLTAICNLFIQNRDEIKSAFPWDSTYIYPVCAAIFTDKGMSADSDRLKYCKDILQEKTGFFSNYRGVVKPAMVSMLAVDNSPEVKLERSLQVHAALKTHFYSSEYLPVAAMIITDTVPESQYDDIAARTRRIYNLMKQEHPFLTSGSDSVFAALLALSQLSDEAIVQETECCYSLLKPNFFSHDAIQSLSHVLALGQGSTEEKCQRTLDLFHLLKSRGYRYGTDYELATLGVLALLPTSLEAIADDLIDVDTFLSHQKGYGFFGFTRKQRLMHAAMLVSGDFIRHNTAMQSAALNSSLAIIAAQNAALCASIAAAAAANNNSST